MNTSNFNSYPNEVYELQSKLRKIAQINGNMSIIIADGIFGHIRASANRNRRL